MSTVDGECGLSGFVEDLDTGRVQRFDDARALVAALSAGRSRGPVRDLPAEVAAESGRESAERRRPAL